MLHGHGDDAYRQGGRVRVNFSSNTPPWELPAGLREYLGAQLDRLGAYPEAAAESLTALLARRNGVEVEQVLVTSGATAGIHLLAQAWRGRRSCVVTPTFAEYEDACAVNGHEVSFCAWEDFAGGRIPAEAEIVWLCNPNNPTGAALDREWLLSTVKSRPATRFVVDQAYAELCEERALTLQEAQACPNLVLVHSLTKRFTIPGLRLGFVAGPAEVVGSVRRFQPPWAVNSLALAAGEFLLVANGSCAAACAEYLEETQAFRRALSEIGGVTVEPTRTGFFLVRLARGTGAELKAWLLREYGLLVRDAGNFRGLDERWVRVSTCRPEENRELVEAMKAWTRLR